MKPLFIITAALEAVVGFALLIAPALVASTVLNATIDSPSSLFMSRLAGAAIVSIAVCCWRARKFTHDSAAAAIVTALFAYNFLAAAVLAYGGMRLGLQGSLIWPAIVAHGLLGMWSGMFVWITIRKQTPTEEQELT